MTDRERVSDGDPYNGVGAAVGGVSEPDPGAAPGVVGEADAPGGQRVGDGDPHSGVGAAVGQVSAAGPAADRGAVGAADAPDSQRVSDSDPYSGVGAAVGHGSASDPSADRGPGDRLVLVDDPAPGVRRITLNRPEKRNALNHRLRGDLIAALQAADDDPSVKVMIVRGAGTCFSAGYDLGGGNEGQDYPHFTAAGAGQWPRHVTETWMGIWDLAKPVIAQVHGYCLAGGSELATGCDLVYVAEDAKMGYPAVRFGVPDMHFHAWFLGMRAAMEMMVTGDSISGTEAVRLGWANRAFPVEALDDEVLAVARRIALIPTDIVSLNKRTVHRAMDAMGLRAAIRAGTELCALGTTQPSFVEFIDKIGELGLKAALQERDEPFSDYRTAGPP